MLKHFRIPILFLFIGSLLGLFLRWQFISPTAGVNYSFFLHGHSHVMFLGWIFNVLYIAFVSNYVLEKEQAIFQRLFYALQVFVVGMLITFPLQGYGLFSIIFSSLHTAGAMLFVVLFFKKTKYIKTTSAWYARIALIFFIISSAGPFALGYLMANDMGQSNWYYFSIYFYLHFQYNGFFLFGVLSLFFSLLERNKIDFYVKEAKTIGRILAVSCIPAYILSVLWAKPGYLFNMLGELAATIQIVALVMFINFLAAHRRDFKIRFNKSSNYFLLIAMVALVLKSLLQLLSGFPSVSQMAYELRPVVIAYLHLVLLGVISHSLFVWYLESELLDRSKAVPAIILYVASFTAMELCLIITPWWRQVFGSEFYSATHWIFLFSGLLSLSCLILYVASFRKKDDKGQFSG
jgi:hypothetical protein